MLPGLLDDGTAEPGRHDELRAGCHRLVDLRGADHGARSHEQALVIAHDPDRLGRGGGTEGHLGHRQTAGDQRVAQPGSPRGVLQDDHGDHPEVAQVHLPSSPSLG